MVLTCDEGKGLDRLVEFLMRRGEEDTLLGAMIATHKVLALTYMVPEDEGSVMRVEREGEGSLKVI